jgi:hypothetical protein
MRPNDAYEHFATTFEYPIERDQVIETTGETRIESPTGDHETIGAVLERSDYERFESPRDLYQSFLTHLSDAHIGRKFYDDRGTSFGPGEIASD